MAKKIIKYIGASIIVLVIIGVGLYTNVIKLPITKELQPSLAYDVSNTETLVKHVDNVFIGKIIKQTGTESKYGGIPYTHFSVSVLSNIKGDLQRTINVRQLGGYRNGILHIVKGGDMIVPGEEGGADKNFLLQIGHVYVFATNHNKEKTLHAVSAFPYDYRRITSDSTLSDTAALDLARQNSRVQDFVQTAQKRGELNSEWQ